MSDHLEAISTITAILPYVPEKERRQFVRSAMITPLAELQEILKRLQKEFSLPIEQK